jgi:hypothetical protein
MVEKVLLDVILEAFLAENKTTPEAELRAFCTFANNWLQSKGVVGVGQTISGFSLRLADSNEYLLTRAPDLNDVGGAVSISGLAGRGDRVAVDGTNVQITGR